MMDELFQKMMRDQVCDWGVALAGASGVPGSAEHLSAAAIAQFANAELAHIAIDDPVLDRVVELASEGCASSADLREQLQAICEAKEVNLDAAHHKWQLYLLQEVLAGLDDDPVYAMIALSEFWGAWDWPTNMPSSLHPDTPVSADQYHSDAYYARVKDEHARWLRDELNALKR
jgi:hypothetical protein